MLGPFRSPFVPTLSIDLVRSRASLLFAALLWIVVPVVYVIARSNGGDAFAVAAFEAGAATVATLAWRLGRGRASGRLVVAAALTMAPVAFVWAGAGVWQIDYHMTFFVVYAMLVAYVDWRPIALSGALTALHHGILDLVARSAVFPEEGLPRVSLHGAVIVFDCLVLIWVVTQMRALFASVDASLGEAKSAVGQLTLFRAAMDSSEDKVFIAAAAPSAASRFEIVYTNAALDAALGYAAGELIGRSDDFLHGPHTDEHLLAELYADVMSGSSAAVEIVFHHRDGTPLPFDTSLHPIVERGKLTHIVSAMRDITARKAAATARIEARIAQETAERLGREIERRERVENELAQAAFHDQLTGLPNRTLLRDRIELALKRSHRRGMRHVALMFLDCDRFKFVNDTFGHAIGDLLLVSLAQRLEATLRPSDTLARIGGDEFVVLLEDIASDDEAATLADRILTGFNEPFVLGEREIFSSASIGVALNVNGTETGDDLLRNADIAMYRAKATGKRRFEIFRTELAETARRRFELENDLRSAIDKHEIVVYYQTILTLENERVAGLEALARWKHPSLGIISPAEFFPIAEETGQIGAISAWVLREACRQAWRWQTTVPGYDNLSMNVNVSAAQLLDDTFVDYLAAALTDSRIAPRLLHIEVSESVLMSDPERISNVLRKVRGLGVEVHLDDFGAGYSSFAYLHRFPLNAIKIDRSFVSGAGSGLANPELVRTVIALARQLDLDVTAEGIETVEQHEQLRAMHCESAQGYLFSRPLDADATTAYLLQQQATAALSG